MTKHFLAFIIVPRQMSRRWNQRDEAVSFTATVQMGKPSIYENHIGEPSWCTILNQMFRRRWCLPYLLCDAPFLNCSLPNYAAAQKTLTKTLIIGTGNFAWTFLQIWSNLCCQTQVPQWCQRQARLGTTGVENIPSGQKKWNVWLWGKSHPL